MARGKDWQTVKRTPKRAPEREHGRDAEASGDPPLGAIPPIVSPAANTAADHDRAPDSLQQAEPPVGIERDLGRYQLLFELARGGMGTVHVGRLCGAHGFDRLVAIKQLRADGAAEQDVEAFLAEARITARISHPNVVPTLELGEHAGRPFIVMELISGVSLARLLSRIKRAGDRLAPQMVMWIMSRVATGLHAAHDLSLIHRDVSPENIILSYEGRVCVADFGVAKLVEADQQTQSGVVKGKFAYMSPEQTEAQELDRRSDLFALGIVLHEALTGERLFAADTMAATIRRVWAVTPCNPRDAHQDVPEALVPVVMRCLAKDRSERYPTAAEVATQLRRVLRDESTVVDEKDLSDLIAEYFPTERADLRRRIDAAIEAVDNERSNVSARPRELDISPAHRSLSTSQQTQTGSVTASVATGPPLSPRRYAGAGLALGLAAVIGGGFWLSQPSAPSAPSAAASNTRAPARSGPSARDTAATGETSAVSPTTASAVPPMSSSSGRAASSVAPGKPHSSTAGPQPAPALKPTPNRRTPRGLSGLERPPRPPDLAPKVQPPTAPTRGRPIDIFDK